MCRIVPVERYGSIALYYFICIHKVLRRCCSALPFIESDWVVGYLERIACSSPSYKNMLRILVRISPYKHIPVVIRECITCSWEINYRFCRIGCCLPAFRPVARR
ncbi:hypothetical protein SDC9_211396 [bioreactor metagenome]|uniref:Uncharacterized protein n=1 Tax=bioreactor metagenome TaxID=1076179 RepID=A0A645JK64_9ZZZZ